MTAPQDQDDPFGRAPSGNFPKVDELEGQLLLIEPSKIESVPRKAEFGGGMADRATADVTVFGPDGVEEYSDMYLSQTVLVNACRQGLKPGGKATLGRLEKVATKASRDALKIGESAADFAAAHTEWLRKGGKGVQPKHVFILSDYDEDDAARVREFLAERTERRTAATPPAVDPFATPEPAAG